MFCLLTRKAYDSIHGKSFINILREFNFPCKPIKLVKISIMETYQNKNWK